MEKVTTRIAYAAQNPRLKMPNDVWGYQVKPGMTSCSLFKLLLDEDAEPGPQDDPRLQTELASVMSQLPEGKTAVEVTTDYLRFLYKHIMIKLEQLLGPETLKKTRIEFYFTKPAVFSLKALDATHKAAQAAGFGSRELDSLSLLCEPEAACISAISECTAKFGGTSPYGVNDGVLLVDLGGGTADLVSYRILSKEPLQLEEICIGVGGKCGGSSCDRALHELMMKKYGEAFSSLATSKTGPGSRFMEIWESIKRDFDGDDMDAEFELHLKMFSGNPDHVTGYDFETDEVTITA
jgi:hypothetical protein